MDESIKLPYTQLLSKANRLLDQDIKVDKPIVVAWGLMNAGKSFLLNMLTNHIETECFRTNDIRETAELKSFETEDFIFLDTPGLDANNGDDLIANEGAAKADIVLFVHQPQGELEKIEIDILRKLKGSFGQFAEQNIILVLSKSDDETPDKISAIEQRMLEQCRDDLGFTPRCFAISGSRFQTGVTQKIDGLVTASHLYDLAKHLDSLNTGVGAVKRERQMIAIEEMIAEFKQVELALHARKLQAKQKIQNGFAPFNKAMDNFRVGMKQNLNKFSSI